jgi:HEAT repeat protein
LRVAPQPGTVTALLAIYQNSAQRLDVRTRALVSLQFFPEPAAESALRDAALSPQTPAAIRRPALKALAAGFPASARGPLQQLLGHTDPHTRDGALRMLRKLGQQGDAAAALAATDHCKTETDAGVRLTCGAKP